MQEIEKTQRTIPFYGTAIKIIVSFYVSNIQL